MSNAIKQNPSDDLVCKVDAFLTQWFRDLHRLKRLDEKLFDFIDEKKKPEEIIKLEEEITNSYVILLWEYNEKCSELSAIAKRLHKEEVAAKTMANQTNTSNVNDDSLANPMAKLPDIKVPKFDGKVRNFTE